MREARAVAHPAALSLSSAQQRHDELEAAHAPAKASHEEALAVQAALWTTTIVIHVYYYFVQHVLPPLVQSAVSFTRAGAPGQDTERASAEQQLVDDHQRVEPDQRD
jgi:hypothetical protein